MFRILDLESNEKSKESFNTKEEALEFLRGVILDSIEHHERSEEEFDIIDCLNEVIFIG